MVSSITGEESLWLLVCLVCQSACFLHWFRFHRKRFQFTCKQWPVTTSMSGQNSVINSRPTILCVSALLLINISFTLFYVAIHFISSSSDAPALNPNDWVYQVPVIICIESHFIFYILIFYQFYTFFATNFYFFSKMSDNNLFNLQKWMTVFGILLLITFDCGIIYSFVKMNTNTIAETSGDTVNGSSMSIIKTLVKIDSISAVLVVLFIGYKQRSLKQWFEGCNLELIFERMEQIILAVVSHGLISLITLATIISQENDEFDTIFVVTVILSLANTSHSIMLVVAFNNNLGVKCLQFLKKVKKLPVISRFCKSKYENYSSINNSNNNKQRSRTGSGDDELSDLGNITVREMRVEDINSVLSIIGQNETGDVAAATDYFFHYFAKKTGNTKLANAVAGNSVSNINNNNNNRAMAGSNISGISGVDTSINMTDKNGTIDDPEGIHFVCCINDSSDKILGVNGVYKNERVHESIDVWWLGWFYVLPSEQHKGIGQILWDQTLKFCKNRKDCRKIYVDVSSLPEYITAKRFYVKNGFVIEGILKDFYDRGEDQFVMGLTV